MFNTHVSNCYIHCSGEDSISCLLLTFPRKPHFQSIAACSGPRFPPSKTPDIAVGLWKQALSDNEVLRDSGAALCVGPDGPHVPGETHCVVVLPMKGGNSPNPRSTNSGEFR